MFKIKLVTLSLLLTSSFIGQAAGLCNCHTIGAGPYSFRADSAESNLVIRDGWVQEGPPSQKITAAYLVIENHGLTDISLKGASSPVAQVIELHKMELTDGLMKMRKIDSINIPAGGQVELKPGSYHLMVIGLRQPLKEGDKVSMTLEFSDGQRRSMDLPLNPRSAVVKEVE